MQSKKPLKNNVLFAIITGLLAVHTPFGEINAVETTRPNMIYIMADDLGYGDLGSYGATRFQTPNIDILAKEGIRFTDAHSPDSVCTPTRYGVLTGRYSWRGRLKSKVLWSGYEPLLIEEGRKTIGHMMKEMGYHTAQIGKWHLGWGDDARVRDRLLDELLCWHHSINAPIPKEVNTVHNK